MYNVDQIGIEASSEDGGLWFHLGVDLTDISGALFDINWMMWNKGGLGIFGYIQPLMKEILSEVVKQLGPYDFVTISKRRFYVPGTKARWRKQLPAFIRIICSKTDTSGEVVFIGPEVWPITLLAEAMR